MFAYMAKQTNNGFFKSKEDVISMFLGLVVVVAVVGFLVNYIGKRKGNIDIPGVSNDIKISEIKKQTQLLLAEYCHRPACGLFPDQRREHSPAERYHGQFSIWNPVSQTPLR